ncbi:MAG: polysaccharide biosynthesis/export family protein [Pseudomonadota bacterium]
MLRLTSPFISLLLAVMACPAVAWADPLEPGPSVAWNSEPAGVGAPASYQVGVGDTLHVVVYGEEDLCGDFVVYEGGAINYPLVGKVSVLGLSLPQVAEALATALGQRFLVDPHVTVQMQAYASQAVQVLGAVAKPGVFYLEGPTTLRQMLAIAGGLISEKAVKEVRLERVVDGRRQVQVVRLEPLLAEGEGDFTLRGGDVVNVAEGLVVYVSGEVKESGSVPYWDGLTVTRALAEAGGPDTYARLRRAFLMRDGQRIVFNLKKLLQGRLEDIPLQPGDQLVIEESVF